MSSRLALLAALLLACLMTGAARAERSVVLVTNASCPIETLSMLQVRKAYFGLLISHEGYAVRALRLNNDDELNLIFHQAIVAMSEKSYERRLRSMLLKYGTPRPPEFDSVERMVVALKATDCSIAYLWRDDAAAVDGIRELRLLWQGD
jgi:hypothetical protein